MGGTEMRRTRTLVGGAVLALVLFAGAGMSGTAHADNLGPCNDGITGGLDVAAGATGANYAKHHIAALAPGGLGNDAHKPGSHRGFSACDPSGG